MALLLLYIIVAAAHAYLAPLTTGPDELAHYEYVNFIAGHGRLPLNTADRGEASYKSDQPPLYHLIAALPAALVDSTGPPYLKRVQDHNRRQLIERTRHAWGLYNTEDEQWPYRAEILRWHVGRWVAILFGAATIAVTYFIAGEVFAGSEGATLRQAEEPGRRSKEALRQAQEPGQGSKEAQSPISNLQSLTSNPKILALAAAAVIAFIPRFALTGSMLNYETTLAFFSALFLWMLLRLGGARVQGSSPSTSSGTEAGDQKKNYALRTTHYTLLTGLFAGLSITVKLSALIFPLEILVAYWLIARHFEWDWKRWLRQVGISAIGVVVAVSWWFGFVIVQFNTIAEDGWWAGLLRPLIAADSSDATTNRLLSFLTGGQAGFAAAIDNLDSGPPWEWLAIFYRTFWMAGIEQESPLGSWGLVVMLAFCLLAVYGLITFWRQPGQGGKGAEEQRSRGAARVLSLSKGEQGSGSHNYATRNTQHAIHPTPPYSKLVLSLLTLHLAAAFALPLIRYAITFSLADTAQGRHILFQTAPAFAILLIWGIAIVNYQLSITNYQLPIIFIPGLFLFIWSLVQLQTMTWAYLPPLPVHTASIKSESAARQINDYVALLEADHRLDSDNRILQVDLHWLSTAVSPFDYLTEVSLLDGQGEMVAQWLGHPAEGRYPTRAWDVGDTVDDTAWLPTGGLDAGQYELQLKLLPTSRAAPQPGEAIGLGNITIPTSTLRIFNSSFPFTGAVRAGSGYTVWQNGQPLPEPGLFRYRETALVTLSPPPGQQRRVHMVGLLGDDRAEPLIFAPVRLTDTAALFIVGPDWPTGDYQLQVTLESDGEEAQQIRSGTVLRVIDRWQRNFVEPPMQQRVEANFADQLKLLGYDLNANRAEPGGGIPLTLYWQGLDWMGQDYTIFTKLLSTADQSVHGGRDRLPREGYSTLYWAPGEIISDPFGVPVDVDAPDGIYYINVGLYQEVNGQAVSLPLVQEGQPIKANSVNIGPIKIGNTPPGITHTSADPQIVLNQPFGDASNLTLLGYDLTDVTGQPIIGLNSELKTLNLKLYWRSESPLPLNYTTFVHLRDQAGEIMAQKDQPPLNGQYPTSLWDSGEIIADEITLPLPADLSSGTYQLVIGLYHLQSGQRLSVPGTPANEVKLTYVEIP